MTHSDLPIILERKKMHYARYGKCEHDFGTSKLLLIVFVRRKKGEGVSVCDLSVQRWKRKGGRKEKERELQMKNRREANSYAGNGGMQARNGWIF